MNPQLMALLASLQGNQMGQAQTGVGPPSAPMGPGPAGPPAPGQGPSPPGYQPADGGPPGPPMAGTYDAQFPQQKGDMYNPPFTGQEETGSGYDQQRDARPGAIPPIPRNDLGALLMPTLIGQQRGPIPTSSFDWNQVTRSMLNH